MKMLKCQQAKQKANTLLLIITTFLYSVTTAQAEAVLVPSGNRLIQLAPDLSLQVAQIAASAVKCARRQMLDTDPQRLVIIDYSLPSTEKRFWLFDLRQQRLLLRDLVAHGKHSGENRAENFSNRPGSLQSSLGLFRVGERYVGKHGSSIRLIGLEPGVNDLALDRAIVIHGADYVSENFIRIHQRLGRSFGCPALARGTAEKVIQYVDQTPSLLFSYYPDEKWLDNSLFLKDCSTS